MTYGDFKVLTGTATSDKILRDKAFGIAKNPKYHRYQRGPASTTFKFFHKKTSATGARSEILATRNKFAGSDIKNENMSDQQLAEEFHKPVIRKFQKRKVHSSYIDNI